MKERVVLAIGRWMPIHLGHKNFLVSLARQYDRLIIGIGSCYENGTPRNCIPAVEREKLLRKILRTEGIPDDKIKIVPVEDRETFEEWIDDVTKICTAYGVTHFCTGNKEDILNVLDEELGLTVEQDALIPVLRRRFSNVTEQNGKRFYDQEINEIFLLRLDDLDSTTLTLQEEEVSEVVWLELDTLVARLEQRDRELCIDKAEFLEVAKAIKEQPVTE